MQTFHIKSQREAGRIIISHADEISEYLADKCLGSLPWLKRDYQGTEKSLLIESNEPQVGKSYLECILLFMNKNIYGRLCIFVLDENVQCIYQFINRMDKFNERINEWLDEYEQDRNTIITDNNRQKYKLRFGQNVKEITNKTPLKKIKKYIRRNRILLTLMNSRLKNIVNTIKNKNTKPKIFTLIDEADNSVCSIKDEPKQEREKMMRDLIDITQHIIYVTATGFAIKNSPQRNVSNYLLMPNNTFINKEYRGYDSAEKIHVELTTNLRKKIEKWNDEDRIVFDSSITKFNKDKKPSQQPKILLMNITGVKENQVDVAQYIKTKSKKNILLVYNGNGIRKIEYINDKWIDEQCGKKKLIGDVLQGIKDNNNKETRNIIIVAGLRASRAETFKTIDEKWTLTHYMYKPSCDAHQETLIQAQRGCGQFDINQPKLKIYISRSDDQEIMFHLENKKRLSTGIGELLSQNMSFRKIITKVPQIKTRGKNSRPDIDDTMFTKYIYGSDYGCFGSLNAIKCFINKRWPNKKYELLTTIYTLKTLTIENMLNDEIKIDFDVSEPLSNLHYDSSQQHKLRNKIKKCLEIEHNIKKKTVQICYNHKRYKQLNSAPFYKASQFKSQVIAFHPSKSFKNKSFKVVVYNDKWQEKDFAAEDFDTIYIWHTTDGHLSCCLYDQNFKSNKKLHQTKIGYVKHKEILT